MRNQVAVVGAGWAGAVVARQLTDAGFRVEVFEQADRVGGHARAEVLNGVVYEPNGAHIFHTSNPRVASFVQQFGLRRPYRHSVLTEVFLSEDDEEGFFLSWPPQVSELERLPLWPQISKELSELPAAPTGADFESYVISLMGPTLYRLFISGYTIKHWDCPPDQLSSAFAPKRVELRRDGYRRLFRDRWEFFHPRGVVPVIEKILSTVNITCGARISSNDLEDLGRRFDVLVLTSPLDDFSGRPGELAWRGITMRSRYIPTGEPSSTVTPAYVVNRPSLRVPYTRTVETKHASGQRVLGTVVSEEFPGASARHYPVPTVWQVHEQVNEELKREIREASPISVFFCGRLANYAYINQDQAVEQAFECAAEVMAACG